jgi:hypothetical protein
MENFTNISIENIPTDKLYEWADIMLTSPKIHSKKRPWETTDNNNNDKPQECDTISELEIEKKKFSALSSKYEQAIG